MSMIIDGTNGLTFNNATTQASAGSIIQVVNVSAFAVGNAASTTSTSLVSTGISASITPKFSTSKILVNFTSNCYASSTANGSFTIYRGSTNLATAASPAIMGGIFNSAGQACAPLSMTFYDSPATTSSTTYTVYFITNTGTIYIGIANGQSSSGGYSFTLQEIAA
jgi:hypothetical protein